MHGSRNGILFHEKTGDKTLDVYVPGLADPMPVPNLL